MAIPNDSLGRHWAEAVFNGPTHGLDRLLLSLVAWGPDKRSHLIGTGFIIAAFGRQALAMSAAHNFEYVARVQRPWDISHATALPEFTLGSTRRIHVDPGLLRAVYHDGEMADCCGIGEVNVVPQLDIASFTIQAQDHVRDPLLAHRVAIDTRMPHPGAEIVALGYASMESRQEEVGDREQFTVERRTCLRRGIISDLHPRGSRVAWPCFETTIPVDPGMSGGPVLWFGPEYGHGTPMVACGVISQDFSSHEARSSYHVPGCSTAAILWPALGLAVHAADRLDATPEQLFLLDLVKRGIVREVGGAATHVRLSMKEGGKVTVTRSE